MINSSLIKLPDQDALSLAIAEIKETSDTNHQLQREITVPNQPSSIQTQPNQTQPNQTRQIRQVSSITEYVTLIF